MVSAKPYKIESVYSSGLSESRINKKKRNARRTVIRNIIIMFVLLLLAALFIITRPAHGETEAVMHTVKSGETLWSIVTDQYGTGINKGELVYNLRELNGKDGKLLSADIYPGQRIKLFSSP